MKTLSAKYVGPIMTRVEDDSYIPSDKEIKHIQEYCLFALYFMLDKNWMERYRKLNLPEIPDEVLKEFGDINMYADQINRFPPDVQNIAKLFFEEFLIPPGAIPTPAKSKKSKFSEWVKQFRYLNEVGGAVSKRAMPLAFKKCKDAGTPVARPAAINSYFITAVSDIMIKDREVMESLRNRNEKTFPNIEDVLGIGDMFDKDEND